MRRSAYSLSWLRDRSRTLSRTGPNPASLGRVNWRHAHDVCSGNLHWRGFIVKIHNTDQNGQCHVCDGEEDDVPPLLLSSFCNVAVHSSVECLGAMNGGIVISAREASNAEAEWPCPMCWAAALSKAKGETPQVTRKKRAAPRGGARGGARGGRGGGGARGGGARRRRGKARSIETPRNMQH